MEQPESSRFGFAAFDEVVTIANGQVDPRETPYRDMVHIGPEDVEERSGRLLAPKIAHTLGLISGKYPFELGQVIYSKIRPHLRKVAIAPFNGVSSADMYPMRPSDGRLLPEFLYYVLLSDGFTTQAVGFQGRTGIPKINRSQLSAIRLPLPPLAEQRAIARALRAVQAATDARRRELDLERERRAAMVASVFTHGLHGERIVQTELGPLPASWSVQPFETLISSGPQNGMYKHADSYGSGVPILRIDAFDHGDSVVASGLKRLQVTPDELILYGLRPNDIVINRVNGSFEALGKTAIVRDLPEPTVYESNMMRLSVDAGQVLPHFVLAVLSSPNGRSQILRKARVINQASINQGDVRSLLLPVPSLQEQSEVVNLLTCQRNRTDTLRREAGLLDELFRAMLEELMSGRLSSVPLIGKGES